jgi:type I restriction enzyme S subunit
MVLGRKQTEIGLIPVDWEVVRLGDVAELIMGQSPPGDTYNEIGKGMPFLQGKAEFGTVSPKHIKHTTKPLKIAPKGSVLISVRAPVGDVNIADIEYCIGRGLSSLSLSKGENAFLFFLLNYFKNEIEKEGTGSTFKAINKSKLQEFKIPIPPLPEQKKIARVLSTIQRAIEQQDKIIEATRKLKKSLMHTLFTEGLNGEEQKETEIGRVPKSWDVMRLGDVCKKPQYGLTASATQIDTGSKFLRISDIQNQKVYWNDVPCCECSEEEIKKYELEKSDIVIARIGATTGKSYLLDESTPLSVFGSYLIRIKTKEELNQDYLYQFFNSARYWEQINKNKGGRLKGGVNSSVLVNLKIPFPPLPEQQQIAHILSTVDKKIEIEERRKATLKELFKSMLHKLMSGEIRLKKVEV